MKKGFFAGAHPHTQLLFAGLILVGFWIIFQFIGMVSGMFLFGLSLNEIVDSFQTFSDPIMVAYLKYVQAFTSFGMFILGAGFTAWFIDIDWKSFLGLKVKPGWFVLIFGVLFIIVILPFTNALAYLNTNIHLPGSLSIIEKFFRDQEMKMTEIMESLLKPGGMGGLFVNLIVIAVIPAIGEELTFRGVVQKLLIRWFGSPNWAIFITAFLFSAIHFQFLSFLPRFFLGLVLGYLFYWSNSIWLPILLHFINNALSVIFYHYYFGGAIGNYMEKIGTPENGLFFTLLSIISGTILIFLIYRKYKVKSNFS